MSCWVAGWPSLKCVLSGLLQKKLANPCSNIPFPGKSSLTTSFKTGITPNAFPSPPPPCLLPNFYSKHLPTTDILNILLIFCLPSGECKLHEDQNFCVFCSVAVSLAPQAVPNTEQILSHLCVELMSTANSDVIPGATLTYFTIFSSFTFFPSSRRLFQYGLGLNSNEISGRLNFFQKFNGMAAAAVATAKKMQY